MKQSEKLWVQRFHMARYGYMWLKDVILTFGLLTGYNNVKKIRKSLIYFH
jgi:hypothetical protein